MPNSASKPTALDKDETKAVVKEAFQEWLDKKYAEFGKWSLRAIGVTCLAALFYFYVATHGFNIK